MTGYCWGIALALCAAWGAVAAGQTAESVSPAPDAPATLPILAAIPENAAFTLAVPPLPRLCAALLAVADRFPLGTDPADVVNATLLPLLGDAGFSDIRNLGACLEANGLAPDAPWGCFLDLSATAADAAEISRQCAEVGPDQPKAPVMAYHPPSWLAMVGVADARVAEESVRRMLRGVGETDNAEPGAGEPSTPEPGFHRVNERFGYAIAGPWLYISDSENLFRSVVEAQARPRTMQEIMATWPHVAGDDVVLVTRLDKVTSNAPDILAVLNYANRRNPMFTWPQAQSDVGRATYEFYAPQTGDDPVVSTLSLESDCVQLASRLNLAAHPGLRPDSERRSSGLAGLVMRGGVVSAYTNSGDSLTEAVTHWSALIPEQIRTSLMERVRAVLRQFACGESILSVQPGAPPSVLFLTHVADAAGAAALLGEYLEPTQLDGLDRPAWRAPLGQIEIFATLEGNVFLATNRGGQMPRLCEMIRAGGAGRFWDALTPPLPPGEVETLFSIDLSQADALVSTAVALGLVPDDAAGAAVVPWLEPIREVRFGKHVESPWQAQFLTIYFKP